MDDNVWEYPFGDLDDDEDMFYRKPDLAGRLLHLPVQKPFLALESLRRYSDNY
jgi:hypothetical protein